MPTGVNVSKTVAYAVLEPGTGVNASKAVAHAVLEPGTGIDVSKAVAYGVLEPGTGVNVSKAVAYAIDDLPPIEAESGDSLAPVLDSVIARMSYHRQGAVSDILPHIAENITTALVRHLSESLSDEMQAAQDEITASLRHGFKGLPSDTLELVRDSARAALLKLDRPGRWVAPLTIGSPAGVPPIRLAAYPVRHPINYFIPRIKSYGNFTRAVSAPAEFIRSGDVTVTVLDPDNRVRQLLEPKTIRKARVELRLGPEGGKYSGFLRPWRRSVGLVSQDADGELSLKMQDFCFEYLGKAVPAVITETNFPNLAEGSGGGFGNLVIGNVSSSGGALKCDLVDRDNNRYFACRHRAASISGVYRKNADTDEWEQVGAGEYSVKTDHYIEHEPGSGVGDYCTLIEFSSDQGGKEIRANIHGVDALDNFADCIHAMFLYLTAWYEQGDIINHQSFEETREKVADLICAGAWTKPITFGEALTQLQRSSNIDIFSDKNDRISVHYTADDEEPVLHLDDLLRLYRGTVKQSLAEPAYNRIPYAFAPNFAANTWTQKIHENPADLAALGEATESDEVKMYFVRDADTAKTVIERRAQYLDLNSFRFEAEIPLVPVLETMELARLVSIRHFGGIRPGGYVNQQFKITELAMDIDNLKYTIKGIRRRLPPPAVVETYGDGTGRGGEIGAGTSDDDGNYIKVRQGINASIGINSRSGPFMNPDVEGELFGIFRHPANDKKLMAWITENTGVTWVERDSANAPEMADRINSHDQFYLDGKIHVATQEKNTGRIAYHLFDTVLRKWTIVDEEIVSSIAYGGSQCVSIECRYPGGEPVIFFQGEREPVSGIYYQRGYYSIRTGIDTWTAPVLVTPTPASYVGNPSSNCMVQRVVAGREDRMHFFYMVNPAERWVAWSPDDWVVTMSGNLTLGTAIPWHVSSVHYPAAYNISSPIAFSNREKIICFMKWGFGQSAVNVFSEGPTIADIGGGYTWGMIVGGGGLGNLNPAGFVGKDDDSGKVYVASGAYPHNTIITAQESADGGNTWSSYLKAGPVNASRIAMDVTTGNFFKVRSQTYMTYFTTEHGRAYPVYRWLKFSELPYTE